MDNINKIYYEGFEGEPEIRFICNKGSDKDIIIIWEGYFDQIMTLIQPEANGWTGLAYYYNMYLGWYEEDSWEMDNIDIAINQFETIDCDMLGNETSKVLKIVINMLEYAVDNNYEVFIERD